MGTPNCAALEAEFSRKALFKLRHYPEVGYCLNLNQAIPEVARYCQTHRKPFRLMARPNAFRGWQVKLEYMRKLSKTSFALKGILWAIIVSRAVGDVGASINQAAVRSKNLELLVATRPVRRTEQVRSKSTRETFKSRHRRTKAVVNRPRRRRRFLALAALAKITSNRPQLIPADLTLEPRRPRSEPRHFSFPRSPPGCSPFVV
jgi:hypothetical protein